MAEVPQVEQMPTPVPSRGQPPAVFNPAANEWNKAIPDMNDQINAVSTFVNTKADEADASATSAAASAAVATAAANYKGEWSDLIGALNIPASVSHDDKFWMLVNNLADVTLSEPGVTADWIIIDTGIVWITATASATIIMGTNYLVDVTGGDITLTYPTTLQLGRNNKFSCFDSVNLGSANRLFIDPGTHTLFQQNGLTEVAAGGDGILAFSIGDSAELAVFTTVKVKVI